MHGTLEPKTRPYSSFEEVRDRITMRRAITLVLRKPPRTWAPADHRLLAEGRAAETRLRTNGKIASRFAPTLGH